MPRALALGLATTLAGCGTPNLGLTEHDRYARELDAFCAAVGRASDGVVRDAARAQRRADSPTRVFRGLGSGLERFSRRTARATDRLARAQPPARFAPFHRETVAAMRTYDRRVRRIANRARTGQATALRRSAGGLSRLGTPDLPGALAQDAESCRDLSG